MTKNEFLNNLRASLSSLSEEDVQRSADYYSEIIDDRIEDGANEEDAVASLGKIDDIISGIIYDIPITKLVKQKAKKEKKRKLKTFEIVLLAAGSPLWIVLLAAAFIIILAIYVVVWSVAISFFAISVSIGACSLAALATPLYFAVIGKPMMILIGVGAGLLLAGIGILAFIGSMAFAKGTVILTKKIILSIKSALV